MNNHLLVVEDEEVLLEVLSDELKDDGWNVLSAKDGEAAVDIIKKGGVSVVLLDLILPKKNGFEVIQEVKSKPELADLPIIVISNLGSDEDIKKAMSMGAVDYFVKTQHPISEIVEKVRKYK